MPQYKWLLLSQIFDTIAKGDIHETNQLEQGITPLIGCSFVNDGVEGFFDPEDFTLYKNAITLASDGSYPLTAFYHPYEFTAKDNVVICSIDKNTKLEEIYYLLSIINSQYMAFFIWKEMLL